MWHQKYKRFQNIKLNCFQNKQEFVMKGILTQKKKLLSKA